MAITAGDEVALLRNPSTPTLNARSNVLFGIVTAVAAPNCSVAWENGAFVAVIPTASLDKIESGSNTSQQPVAFTDSAGGRGSPAYQGQVVRAYKRDPNDSGAPVDFVLLRTSSGQLYEAIETAIEELDGQ